MVEILEDKEIFKDYARVIFDGRSDDTERTKWLSTRCNSIGGSEIGAIAGYSEYGSALTVFNEKLGLSEKFKGNIHTIHGNRMEPLIRDWFQEDFKKSTGIGLKTFEYPFMMVSKKYDFLSANIDGLAIMDSDFTYSENKDTGEIKQIPKGELVGLEIKTGSSFNKKVWAGEEIPTTYLCQIYHYMNVTGLNYFFIVYFLEKVVEWKVISRNDQDIKMLEDVAVNFWFNHILTKIPPEPTGLDKETKDILYQQSLQEGQVEINGENIVGYQEVSDKIKELEKEKERFKQLIFLDMGNAKKAVGGGYKLSRFNVSRDNIDNKMLKEKYPATYETVLKGKTEYVNMRISKLK